MGKATLFLAKKNTSSLTNNHTRTVENPALGQNSGTRMKDSIPPEMEESKRDLSRNGTAHSAPGFEKGFGVLGVHFMV